jgi:hypothetical protein
LFHRRGGPTASRPARRQTMNSAHEPRGCARATLTAWTPAWAQRVHRSGSGDRHPSHRPGLQRRRHLGSTSAAK